MNVKRVKTLIIIFFALINALLFGLGIARDSRGRLSERQLRAAESMLAQNGITVSARLPINIGSLMQLELSQEYMNIDYVAGWLFPDGADVKRTEEFNKITLTSGSETLRYDSTQMVFDASLPAGGALPDFEAARRLCGLKLAELNNPRLDFTLDRYQEDEDGYTLEYRVKYENNVVYSSYVKFLVTWAGIAQVRCSLFACVGYTDAPVDICPTDEMLLTLMHELRNIYGDETLDVTGVDIVFVLDFSRTNENGDLKALPYYRVYIGGYDAPVLINAYFNTAAR